MPAAPLCWRHVIINTYASWLPGDPRGWRSRHHRQHSSGDYKHRPPEGEHKNIYDHSQSVVGSTVVIPPKALPLVGRVIVDRLTRESTRIVAISVAAKHAHLLVELPDDMTRMRLILGRVKAAASHAIRDVLPGRVWAVGGTFKRINDRHHQLQVYQYILDHRTEGAWVWSFKDGLPGVEGKE